MAKEIGILDSTTKRYRNIIKMDNLYNGKKIKRRKMSSQRPFKILSHIKDKQPGEKFCNVVCVPFPLVVSSSLRLH